MPGPRRSPALRARALSLLADGWSLRAIGRELDVHHTTVSWWRDGGGAGRPDPIVPWRDAGDRQRDAWAYLFGAYLGDGHVDAGGRLRIFCDEAYPGIIAEVDRALRLLGVTRPWHTNQQGCRAIGTPAQDWARHLPSGRGPKHGYPLTMMRSHHQAIETRPHLVLRGLIHSDGCRFINCVRGAGGGAYAYPTYDFRNRSAQVHQIFLEASLRVGVRPRHTAGSTLTRVARRADVQVLDLFIGAKR